MGVERRKSVRIKKVLSVRYSLADAEKKWDMSSVRDISETGISFLTYKEFSAGDIMNFFIKIPSRPLDWVELRGKVIGSEGGKPFMGEPAGYSHVTRVEFLDLKDEQRGLIREYITWFLSNERGGKG